MFDARNRFDRLAGYYARLANAFSGDDGEVVAGMGDVVKDYLPDLLFKGLLPDGFSESATMLKDSVPQSANDAAALRATSNVILFTYFTTNYLKWSIYRSPGFKSISRFGGPTLAIGSLVISIGEHLTVPVMNASKQQSILNGIMAEMSSFRDSFTDAEQKSDLLQSEYDRLGCNKAN
jgi:hypothetical protein